MKRNAAIGLGAMLLVACMPQAYLVFDKPGVTQEMFEHDRLECVYQAELATANYGSSYRATSVGEAIGAGIGLGIAVNEKTSRLIQLCMRVKGYTITGGDPPPSDRRYPGTPN